MIACLKQGKLTPLQVQECKVYEKFETLLQNQFKECKQLESELSGVSVELSELSKQMVKISDYYDKYKLMLTDEYLKMYKECKIKLELIRDCRKVEGMNDQ